MFYVWVALIVVAVVLAAWIAALVCWAVLLWRLVRSGTVSVWDELALEDAELQPFASWRPLARLRRAAPARSTAGEAESGDTTPTD